MKEKNATKNEGTFECCTNCNTSLKCCSKFNKINAPVLNKRELENIEQIVVNKGFYEKLAENIYTLKLKENNCIFYENDKCTIYENRPDDCKLYPFDIIKIDQKYYLIMYLLECINNGKLEKESTSIDLIVNNIIPWINEFTDERNFTKMKDKKYKIIKEIQLKNK